MKARNLNQQKIGQVPLFCKLKSMKGSHYIRKFLNFSQFFSVDEPTIYENKRQTFLIVVMKGKIEMMVEKRKKKQQIIISQTEYYMVDKSTQFLYIDDKTQFYKLGDKPLYDIFEGILSFSYLNDHLKRLKQSQFFKQLERKVLIKIAFSLTQIKLRIGSIIYQENQKVDNFYLILDGQIELSKVKKPLSILGKNQVFGNFLDKQKYKTEELAEESAKVISQYAVFYKIKSQTLFSNEDKVLGRYKSKWRQERLSKVSTSQKSSKKKLDDKSNESSFLKKEMLFQNVFKNTKEDIKRLSVTCTPIEKQSRSRQQFYGRKLDKIHKLQQRKWGNLEQEVVLYKFPINRSGQKRLNEILKKERVKTQVSKNSSFNFKTF